MWFFEKSFYGKTFFGNSFYKKFVTPIFVPIQVPDPRYSPYFPNLAEPLVYPPFIASATVLYP